MTKLLTGRAMITAGMRDAPHLSAEVIAEVRDKTPIYLRAAVIDGDPTMGAGNVYQVPRSDIEYDYIRNSKGKYIDVPAHWKRIGGLDVGFNCTAFVCLAHDTDSDVVYLIDEYVVHLQPPAVIRQGIKYRKGDKFPIMIDPAANGRSQTDGKKLILEYRGPPNDRIDVRSADNAVEAGIHRVWELLSTGRLKIFKHCTATLKEYEMYHRDINGKVVKKNDHCCDALRYAIMGIRQAKLIYQNNDVTSTYKNPYSFGNT